MAQGLDRGYDTVGNIAMQINPLAGMIVKGGGFLSKGLNALGLHTDGKTAADAILGSSFLSLTPLGLANSIGARKTDTITKDDWAFANTGNAYTGTENAVDEALTKMGKYGMFLGGARNRANRFIREQKNAQNLVADIGDRA